MTKLKTLVKEESSAYYRFTSMHPNCPLGNGAADLKYFKIKVLCMKLFGNITKLLLAVEFRVWKHFWEKLKFGVVERAHLHLNLKDIPESAFKNYLPNNILTFTRNCVFLQLVVEEFHFIISISASPNRHWQQQRAKGK